jgi:hypothetical protein
LEEDIRDVIKMEEEEVVKEAVVRWKDEGRVGREIYSLREW